MQHKNLSAPALATVISDSAQALWSWDLSSDAIYLSDNAMKVLALSESMRADSMSALLTHVPPSFLPALLEMRENVLNGHNGSHLEVEYPFDALRIREVMLVLARDAKGRASSVLGLFEQLPPQDDHHTPAWEEDGVWQCRLPEMWLRFNPSAAYMLNLKSDLDYSPETWATKLHPTDADTLLRQLTLLTAEPRMDGRLEMSLRVPAADGMQHLRLSGSVLERQENGSPVLLWGSLRRQTKRRGNTLVQDESQRLLFAVNSTGDGLWDWDSSTNKVYFSPLYLSMLGYTSEEFPGHLDVWAKKIHPDDHDKIIYPQRDIVASPRYGDTFECTYRLLRKDGTWAWILGRGYVTNRDEQGRATRLVGMHTDITTVQGERDKLEKMIQNDTLTGLRSRSYLNLETARLDKNGIRPVCAIAVDVTGLKMINDLMGHDIGDKLLTNVAILLREPLRATDCVARMGGDEFIILLTNCAEERATSIVDKLRHCLASYIQKDDALPIRLAIGVSTTHDPQVSLNTLMRLADREMLLNKAAHRAQDLDFIQQWIEKRNHTDIVFKDSRLPASFHTQYESHWLGAKSKKN